MLDKYATDSFIIELGAIPDNHDIRVEFSYFMELRKVKDGNEFETHRNYFQQCLWVKSKVDDYISMDFRAMAHFFHFLFLEIDKDCIFQWFTSSVTFQTHVFHAMVMH